MLVEDIEDANWTEFSKKTSTFRISCKIFILFFLPEEISCKKKISFGQKNQDKTVYIVKPDYQDGVEGLLSLLYKQILYIDFAKRKGYVPFVDWKNYKTQYYDGKKNNTWDFFLSSHQN